MSEVTSFHVTGDWRHIIDDGMVDLDALPDEALPTGHVVFTPLSPSVAVAGAPAVAHTLATIKTLIAGGELTDLQGREGVWLAGDIGGQTVRWRATTHLEFHGAEIDYPVLEFDLTGDVRLTGIIRNDVPNGPPVIVDPRIEALIEDAQAVLADAQNVVSGLEASEAGALAARDEAVASAESASTSEANAKTSESNAAASAGSAEEGREEAESARDQAKGYATTAQGHANDASSSSASARGYRDDAESSATSAGEDRDHVDSVKTLLEKLLEDTEAWSDVKSALEHARSQWAADIKSALDDLRAGVNPALDTLEELAAALGNDPNFAKTVLEALGEKATKKELAAVQGAVDAVSWGSLPGKPSSFPPATHGHEWDEIRSKPGSYPPSSHKHTVSQVDGLKQELEGKATPAQVDTKIAAALDAKIQLVAEYPDNPVDGVLYLKAES